VQINIIKIIHKVKAQHTKQTFEPVETAEIKRLNICTA